MYLKKELRHNLQSPQHKLQKLLTTGKQRSMQCLVTATACLLLATPAQAAEPFTDVPADHWAASVVEELRTLGFSDGIGDNQFGLGQTITRAQFAAFLAKVEGYQGDAPQAFRDNTDANAWYYGAVNAMAAHHVIDASGTFRPNNPITRAEMTELMVGALGFHDLGKQLNNIHGPFQDVTAYSGFITLANDFGLVGGMDATHFAPNATATREQAAAMLVRLYHTKDRQLTQLHGFYAISSASQSNFIGQLDSTGFGWARLILKDGHASLNMTSSDKNEYYMPKGYEEPLQKAHNSGTALLSVYADNHNGLLTQVLSQPALRTEAVQAITAAISDNNAGFDGVLLDFESLRAGQKSNYTALLQELRTALGSKPIYVAIHPALNGSAYYDGYDYAAIGKLADRVILMAYDYAAQTLSESEMAQGYTQTPLSPLNQVYYALRACLNGGISADKLLLGVSMDTAQWKLQNGAVIHNTPYHPAYAAVQARLATGCQVQYPNYSYNPYAAYTDNTDATENILWFENEQSIGDKAELARLLGLRGISVWRLGTIPTDSSTGLNIWRTLTTAVH